MGYRPCSWVGILLTTACTILSRRCIPQWSCLYYHGRTAILLIALNLQYGSLLQASTRHPFTSLPVRAAIWKNAAQHHHDYHQAVDLQQYIMAGQVIYAERDACGMACRYMHARLCWGAAGKVYKTPNRHASREPCTSSALPDLYLDPS